MSSSKSKSKPVDTRSAEQRKFEAKFASYLSSYFRQTATPYEGKLVADMPFALEDEFDMASVLLEGTTKKTKEALETVMKGTPAYKYNERAISKTFEEQFASPMMKSYAKNVIPVLEQQYAGIPGGLFSTSRAKGIKTATDEYYASNIQPQYFNAWQAEKERAYQSTERAAERAFSAIPAYQSLPATSFGQLVGMGDVSRQIEQNKLSAAYQEFLRTTPESSPWLQAGLSYLSAYKPYQVGVSATGPSFGYAAGEAFFKGLGSGIGSSIPIH